MALEPASEGRADFYQLVSSRKQGRLKIYIGSAAGVGKTYRMLNEAHELVRRGVDLVVGWVDTHGRKETAALVEGLEVVPRRKIEYRGVVLEEMDLDAVIARRPDIAIVDELAHTNVTGSRHMKRWEDVLELVDDGINVITAVNIQHIESLNDIIARTLGVTVRETVPDWMLSRADQVVNIDVSAEDLRQRLMEGKIYAPDKVPTALTNFFTEENLTTLRELALREVANSVDKLREEIAQRESGDVAPGTGHRILVAMSSAPLATAALLRKASRIAGRLNTDWYCVYVQTPQESAERIDSSVQRKLVDNIQLAQSMGAEVVKLVGPDPASELVKFARGHGVSLIIVGQTQRTKLHRLMHGSVIHNLLDQAGDLDVMVVSFNAPSQGDAIPTME